MDIVKIKINGVGGNGIKYLSTLLAEMWGRLGYKTTVSISYDSAVRGGNISADVCIGKNEILVPIIDDGSENMLVDFNKSSVSNKLTDKVYDFLQAKGVKNVVIMGMLAYLLSKIYNESLPNVEDLNLHKPIDVKSFNEGVKLIGQAQYLSI